MNRRNFLKRLAAVAAGAVAVPTVVLSATPKMKVGIGDRAKSIIFVGDYNKYTWAQIKGWYRYKEDPPEPFLTEVSKYSKVPVGTIHCAGDGRVYRYMKNCTTKQLIREALC